MLPAPGEVLVRPGQRVQGLDVVAQTQIPSRYRVINVARQLGQPQLDMSQLVQVEIGDFVNVGAVIATLKGKVPLFQRSVRAPAEGYIAQIGPGWVLLETEQTTVEIQAFIDGTVSRIFEDWGVLIEATGTKIEAACGFGGEAYGRLKRRVDSPYEALEADAIDESVGESIVLGGRTISEEALRQAEAWKARGIIVGSIQASLLNLEPPVKVRVVATEGFGDLPMAAHTFGLLTSLGQRRLSIRGQSPHLVTPSKKIWADETPLILAPREPQRQRSSNYSPAQIPPQRQTEATIGSRVHITHGRLLGASGLIEAIPIEPKVTQSGIIAPGAFIKINNETHFIPWTNLELID